MLRLEHIVVTPTTRRFRRPLLLLHGAWHGAWCWHPAMHDFAARGFAVHAISLRGHGGSDRARSFNLTNLRDYVDDLRMALAAITPTPLVIGHSLGGFVVQLLLEEQTLPGAVLLATIPVTGARRFVLSWMVKHPLACTLALLTGDGKRTVGTPRLAREAFFRPNADKAMVERAVALLGPESLRIAIWEAFTRRPRTTLNRSPLLVIAAERDAVFTLEEQHRTAAAYNAELVIVPEAAHDLMLDPGWNLAAAAIERFARAQDGPED